MGYSKRLASEFLRRRIEAGLSQDEVRQKSGLGSQNIVSMLERNVHEKPSMEDLVKLGKVYKLTPNDIAEFAGWWSPAKQPEIPKELQEIEREVLELNPVERHKIIEMFTRLVQAFRVAEQQRDTLYAAAAPLRE